MIFNENNKAKVITNIKNGLYDNNRTPPFLEDDDIALAFIIRDPENIKYVERFFKNQEVLLTLIKMKKIPALIYMDDSLKSNFEFAKKAFNISNETLGYFFEEVRNKKKFIDEAIINLKGNIILAEYLKKNQIDDYYKALENTPSAYVKLTRALRNDEKAIVATLNGKNANQYSVDYMGLPYELKDNLNVLVAYINHLSDFQIHYKSTVERLKQHIKDDDKLNFFHDNYKREYNKVVMKVLCSNKNFKQKYSHLLDEFPKILDYRVYMREADLKEKVEEQSIQKEETRKPRAKI